MALTWWRLAAAFSAVSATDLLRILWSRVQWRIWSSSFQPLNTSKQMHSRSDLALPCGSNISWPHEKENIKHQQQKIVYNVIGYFKFLLRCCLEMYMLNELFRFLLVCLFAFNKQFCRKSVCCSCASTEGAYRVASSYLVVSRVSVCVALRAGQVQLQPSFPGWMTWETLFHLYGSPSVDWGWQCLQRALIRPNRDGTLCKLLAVAVCGLRVCPAFFFSVCFCWWFIVFFLNFGGELGEWFWYNLPFHTPEN